MSCTFYILCTRVRAELLMCIQFHLPFSVNIETSSPFICYEITSMPEKNINSQLALSMFHVRNILEK